MSKLNINGFPDSFWFLFSTLNIIFKQKVVFPQYDEYVNISGVYQDSDVGVSCFEISNAYYIKIESFFAVTNYLFTYALIQK